MMHKLRYAEVQEDCPREARDRERTAFERSIALLEAAENDRSSASAANAIFFTSKLWTVLIEDLASPDNGLPKELRAQIVSVGIWLLRELERIRNEESKSFADVIQISRAIRDGLL